MLKKIIFRIKIILSNDLTCGFLYLKKQKINFPHPIGIVIGRGVKIGKNCTIYQNVTIGTKTVEESTLNLYPILGNNVIVGANSVIFGNIKIGNNVYIGAGTIVNKDISDNCIVIGNPFKIISTNG